jgi:SAM-dependent methyltransferase
MHMNSSGWHVALDLINADAYAVLQQDRIWNCFAIADLAPPFHEYSRYASALERVDDGTRQAANALAGSPGSLAACLILQHPQLTVISPYGAQRGAGAGYHLGVEVEFQQMDAQHLDLPDALFDGVRAERLLQHVLDPDAALSEMVRVAKPGAQVVGWEGDLDLFVIDAPDYATSRAMQRFICDSFRNGRIGHELYRRFKDLGLTDVQATPIVREFTDYAFVASALDLRASAERAVAAGVITQQQARDWLASLDTAREAGRFFCASGGFLAFGRKPH